MTAPTGESAEALGRRTSAVERVRVPDDYPESVHDEASTLLGMVRRQRSGWRFHLDLRAPQLRTWVWCSSEPGHCRNPFGHEAPTPHERGVMEYLSPPVCSNCGGDHIPSACSEAAPSGSSVEGRTGAAGASSATTGDEA